jgi:hypothetical protein
LHPVAGFRVDADDFGLFFSRNLVAAFTAASSLA